jgi:hypothetical protein
MSVRVIELDVSSLSRVLRFSPDEECMQVVLCVSKVLLSSRVVLMFLLSCWQANLANEKNMLAGQVKKLMRDVAKVVSIKAIWTAELCFEECVLCIGVVLC